MNVCSEKPTPILEQFHLEVYTESGPDLQVVHLNTRWWVGGRCYVDSMEVNLYVFVCVCACVRV